MQHFNVWDFASAPHDLTIPPPILYGVPTKEEAVQFINKYMPAWIRHYVSEYFAVLVAKAVLLDDYPTSNAATQALLSDVIPTGTTSETERRYIALMKREISTDYETGVALCISRLKHRSSSGWDWFQSGGNVQYWLADLHHRCDRMVALMAKCESLTETTPAAANPAWIREGALVEGGEAVGVELTVGPNPLSYRQTAQGGLAGFRLPAVSTWHLGAFARLQLPEPDHIRDRVADSTAVTLTARNGPIEYRAGADSAAWVVLAKDSSISWTKATLESVVRIAVNPIEMPTVFGTLADITIQGVGAQTVDVSGSIWTGTRLATLTVASSAESVATATYVSASQDIAVQGVGTSTATIIVTRTDAAGQSVSLSFDVTVTAAQE